MATADQTSRRRGRQQKRKEVLQDVLKAVVDENVLLLKSFCIFFYLSFFDKPQNSPRSEPYDTALGASRKRFRKRRSDDQIQCAGRDGQGR